MIGLVLAAAVAAQPAPAAAPPPEKEFVLRLTTSDLQEIAKQLVERPYKEVAPLMDKLADQVNHQPAPAPAAKK